MDELIRLSNTTLEKLPSSVQRPRYDRTALKPGIVHIGLGNFHRAHQAWYLHRLFEKGLCHDWAIIGAGIPLTTIGLSGFYSKDSIIEQAFLFGAKNPHHPFLKWVPVAGAFITAFYMFRMWFMTFTGEPRDKHRYDHAHESPRVMTGPLVVLATFTIAVGWSFPGTNLNINNLLEQAMPVGTLNETDGVLLPNLIIPDEHERHNEPYFTQGGIAAFVTGTLGLLLAAVVYLWRWLDPDELKQTFRPFHSLLLNKWWFDELYNAVFVVPTMLISKAIARFDRDVIDSLLHGAAAMCRGCSQVVDVLFDRTVVDGSVNGLARGTWDFGLSLRKLQTGSLRQYVMFIAIGTVLLFVAITAVQAYLPSG